MEPFEWIWNHISCFVWHIGSDKTSTSDQSIGIGIRLEVVIAYVNGKDAKSLLNWFKLRSGPDNITSLTVMRLSTTTIGNLRLNRIGTWKNSSHLNCDEHGKLKSPLLTSDLLSDYSGGSGTQRLQKTILEYRNFRFPNGIALKTWRVKRWKHIEIVISDRWLFALELWQVDRIRAMEFYFESELYGLWSPISIEADRYVLRSIYVDWGRIHMFSV